MSVTKYTDINEIDENIDSPWIITNRLFVLNRPQLHPLWHKVHKRLTSSLFGACVGHCMYNTPEDAARRILIPSVKSSEAIKHGLDKEPVVREWYKQEHPEYKIIEVGMAILKDRPYIGASPDGLVDDDGMIEIKCSLKPLPKSIRRYKEHKNITKIYDEIPEEHSHIIPSHYDQMQGCMAVYGRKWCDYIFYAKDDTFVHRIPFNEKYWQEFLLPKLDRFYNVFLKGKVNVNMQDYIEE